MDILIFGNPLVGKPIATEHMSAPVMTRRFGCGSSMDKPIWRMSGRTMRAATVWEMKVAMTRIMAERTINTPYRLRWWTSLVILLAIVVSRPDEVTALPRQRPPAARMMIVQRKLLKSSLLRIPVPKNRIIGRTAITPMSPKTCSRWWLAHHRTIVAKVTRLMKYWTPVNLSFTGLMGTMVVPRPGWNVKTRRPQINRMQMMQTGSAIKNHVPQSTPGCMFCRAMMFCGDAIGDAAPPTLAAKAIPRTTAFANLESGGRFRKRG